MHPSETDRTCFDQRKAKDARLAARGKAKIKVRDRQLNTLCT